ncbi:tyrosine-protein phosphatase [Sphingobacterium hotanense]|uniref:tyrosine-protein phosphatase n=1 Tax=Sphingobacterium hotanense TaxID=649196 RepID=UPI0011F4067E|nr:tyrosine-protein phosphatase [Sphingobacterium hotanense]
MNINKYIAFTSILMLGSLNIIAQTPKVSRTLEEALRADRVNSTSYRIYAGQNMQGNYFIGKTVETIDYSKPFSLAKDSIVAVEENERLYFASILAGDTILISERLIPLEGPSNFRDIGGVKTKDGKQVKWGQFYRADALGSIQEDEFPYIESLKISKVYDLRSDEEIATSKDNLPASIRWIHHPIFNGDNSAQMNAVMQKIKSGDMTAEDSRNLLITANKEFINSNLDAFKVLVRELLDNEEPSLFHCTAGKDRTGLTSALLLSVLGVDKETVINEYLMTNYYTLPKMARKKDPKMAAAFANIDPQVMLPLMSVDRSYLEAAFTEIEKQYGDMDKFIREGLEISDAERMAYQMKYTY